VKKKRNGSESGQGDRAEGAQGCTPGRQPKLLERLAFRICHPIASCPGHVAG
jgi:hypothetical protein